MADRELAARLPTMIEGFTEKLYRAELDAGRTHSNIVVSETPAL